jgi:hypothetical protein
VNAAPARASVAGNVVGTPTRGCAWKTPRRSDPSTMAWPAMVSTIEAAATKTVSISPVHGVVSLEPGQSFHQNATMATASSAKVDIGPRISSDVWVLPVPAARAKKTAAPGSRPPRPSQGWAARRWRCRSANAWGCRCGGVVSSGRPGSGSGPRRVSRPARRGRLDARPVTSHPAALLPRRPLAPAMDVPAGARWRSAVRGPGSRWRGRRRWRSPRRSRPARSPRRP